MEIDNAVTDNQSYINEKKKQLISLHNSPKNTKLNIILNTDIFVKKWSQILLKYESLCII